MESENGDLFKSQLWNTGDDLEKAQVANKIKQVEGNNGRNTPSTPNTRAIPPMLL